MLKVTFTKNKMLKFKLIKPYLKQIRLQEDIGLAILSNEEKYILAKPKYKNSINNNAT